MAKSPFEQSVWKAVPPEGYCLTDLPGDVLVLVLEHLVLEDLANVRLVCSRFQQIVDDSSLSYLWANSPVESWVSPANKAVMLRAADCGNVEVLIKLAVAYLYSEGVPDGPGKGTISAFNGLKTTEYLCRAERLRQCAQPFAWVLFRAPWAPGSLCCKASVCHQMKALCKEAHEGSEGLHYCVSKALCFNESDDFEQKKEVMEWYHQGANLNCPYSALEIWRLRHKPTIADSLTNEIQCLRRLREAASLMTTPDSEAQFELCEAYAQGHHGGVGRDAAYDTIRQTMAAAQPTHSSQVACLQRAMTPTMRYILIDWLCEVAEMKALPSSTLHLAVSLMDRYMLHRRVQMTQFQLLGITALLIAARWTGLTIITIREAAWLTDYTYKYEDVVRKMGEVVAALRGHLRRSTISDYLRILLQLAGADELTWCMATFLSECLLLHLEFQRFSAAQLAAACVLNSKILLGHEYPWPAKMVQATGFTVASLQKCCLMNYHKCLSGKFTVKDHRHVELSAVKERFATDRFCNVSNHQVMSFKELKAHLGVEPDSPCLLLTPDKMPRQQEQQRKSKVLSFLSDSCYLSSSPPCGRSISSSEPPSDTESEMSSSDYEIDSTSLPGEAEESETEEEFLAEQFSTQRLSSAGSSSATSPTLDIHDPTLFSHNDLSSHLCSLQSAEQPSTCVAEGLECYSEQHGACAANFKPLDFPQPTFSDSESDSECLPDVRHTCPEASHPSLSSSFGGERMDTSDHYISGPPPPSVAENHLPNIPSRQGYHATNDSPHVLDFQLSEPVQGRPSPSCRAFLANTTSDCCHHENLPSNERTSQKKGHSQFGLPLQRAALRPVENLQHGCSRFPHPGKASPHPKISPGRRKHAPVVQAGTQVGRGRRDHRWAKLN